MFSALAETFNRISPSRIPQKVGRVGIWDRAGIKADSASFSSKSRKHGREFPFVAIFNCIERTACDVTRDIRAVRMRVNPKINRLGRTVNHTTKINNNFP